MSDQIITILLIEAASDNSRLVREMLGRADGFELEWSEGLTDGLLRVRQPGIDVVLLDLGLSEAPGLETLRYFNQVAPRIPIVVLSDCDNREQMRDAIKFGAEDYLVRGAFTAELLARSIRYAIDRRQARETIAEARDSALESARLRGEFLANMSHEIRTPLNGIVGMTRLLIDTPLTPEQREMIDIARQSADALLRIVNDILDFSKISAGKVTLEETDFDLGTAVESVIALFAEQANRKGVELAGYVDSDVPVALRGDPARLCQILTNLVGNAVKFTPHGEVALRASLVSDGANDLTLRFTVKDTGIGIPLEGQRHLFQAFAQADGSTTRKFGGTGLGLAICAQLVELMSGNIGVRSEPGGGSLFWFTALFRQQPSAALTQNPALTRLAGMRMLVTDHSSIAAHIVQQHAVAWGIRAAIATSAAEAMVALTAAAATNHPYNVVLIEMQNPSIDGLTLARAIKADTTLARTHLIGMYALGARPDESTIRAAGIRALLVKPIKQTQLFNTLSVTRAAIEEAHEARSAAPVRRRRVRELRSTLPAEVRARIQILLVEDNLVNQQVQLRILERMGFTATPANHGREALAALERSNYSIILMDCQMPEMDGYTATREIRRRERGAGHTVIIGVTAHALAGDREECLAAGMDDYVSKPVVPEDLAATLDKWARFITASAASSPQAAADGLGVDHKVGQDLADEILDQEILAELRECQRPGETDFVTNLLAVFVGDLDARLATLRGALESNDLTTVREAAHSLKGASREIGARRLAAACERVEDSARDGKRAAIPSLIIQIEREAEALRGVLSGQLEAASA
jgi:signal transduction histidine kinase/HPt (histidine-containing phosphotransfer) domain-containing protein/BarA-like signal transduction histidine kinase